MVHLFALHTRANQGDEPARVEIAQLVRQYHELDFVFYCFRSASQRGQDARKVTKRDLKKATGKDDAYGGGWGRLREKSSIPRPFSGGLPSLGKK